MRICFAMKTWCTMPDEEAASQTWCTPPAQEATQNIKAVTGCRSDQLLDDGLLHFVRCCHGAGVAVAAAELRLRLPEAPLASSVPIDARGVDVGHVFVGADELGDQVARDLVQPAELPIPGPTAPPPRCTFAFGLLLGMIWLIRVVH